MSRLAASPPPGADQPDECALILAPFGQDGPLIADALAGAGVRARTVRGLDALCTELPACGVALLTTEALEPDSLPRLEAALRSQPPWSDLPIVLLAGNLGRADLRAVTRALGNLTILPRPLPSASLVTVVRAALRARRRQYEVRDLLAASGRQQKDIAALNAQLQRSMTETHHRVKNNLQVIAALAEMPLMETDVVVSANDLRRVSVTVRTLAALHDLLTQTAKDHGAADAVSTRALLDRILPLLKQIAPNRALHTEYDDARLTTRQGASFALVVNELVSNALKHGRGEVAVTFQHDGRHGRLRVCDDGAGFPPDFDVRRAANTGLELVESLSRWDLGGDARYDNRPEGGACVTVTLPVA